MRFILTLIFTAFLALPALTTNNAVRNEDNGLRGGFEWSVNGALTDTIAKALKLSDNTRILLTGHIVSSIADKKFYPISQDSTYGINVHITSKQFEGNIITPTQPIQLSSKVEKPNAPEVLTIINVNKFDSVK